MAAAFKLPVLFIIQNNFFAISEDFRKMTGLNSGEMSDLTFVVYDSVTKCFFN